ncbi:hypothetical protein [Pseudoxanthomonas sp. UTMC 1351]|uniref:hypothetical protein n=1 Tax=Pseudoxanthomonas sp. UTMC 1351 TaxID=2695853 RepID=UPI0034CD78ED
MKLRAILYTTALGLGMGAAAGVAAQENSGIVGEKGIIGEKGVADEEQSADGANTPASSSQLTKRDRAAASTTGTRGTVAQPVPAQRIDAASAARLRQETVTAPNRGLAPRPAVGPGPMGQRGSNQNGGGKGPPNEPPKQNMGRLTGDAGWASQSDEKLPHKEPKGPDKMPNALGSVDRLGNAGLAGKSDDKPPKEPKDPKGPDKLGNTALKVQTLEAAATRTNAGVALPATQVRAADAAQQAQGAVQSRP